MSSFSSFKTLEDALTHFNIVSKIDNILFPEKECVISPYLVEELAFTLKETAYNISEAAICEAIIYPILKEVWKNFTNSLFLWSHRSLSKKSKNSGIPDYIIAKRSPLGKGVMDMPMLVMIEAKKDDFDEGWGQCLAQMHLAQQLSNHEYTIYGIVSNGDMWQFGYLENTTLTQNMDRISISNLQKLCNTLYFIFETCEKQLK